MEALEEKDTLLLSIVDHLPLGTLSGVAKGGPGQARARPKHHVRVAHVTQSRAKLA